MARPVTHWIWATAVCVLLALWVYSRASEPFELPETTGSAATPEEAQPAPKKPLTPQEIEAKYADDDKLMEAQAKALSKARAPYTAGPRIDAEAPRFWVGSAFNRANDDMVRYPEEWTFVRNNAGMFVHPMGWKFLNDAGRRFPELVKQFRKPWFTYLENLNAITDPERHVLYRYDIVKKVNPAMECAGVYIYVANSMLCDETLHAAERMKKYTAKAREMGIPVYLIVTPMDQKYFDKYLAPFEGQDLWVWFAKYTGATGVAIDYPIGHFSTKKPTKWFADPQKGRTLAIKMAQTTQAAGLKFIWVLNGFVPRNYTLANVRNFVQDLRDVGVFPDWWLVDQFRGQEFPGTPECTRSVTGQAMALMIMDRPLDGKRPKAAWTRAPGTFAPDCPTPRPEGELTLKDSLTRIIADRTKAPAAAVTTKEAAAVTKAAAAAAKAAVTAAAVVTTKPAAAVTKAALTKAAAAVTKSPRLSKPALTKAVQRKT